jgi:hypothetical protein
MAMIASAIMLIIGVIMLIKPNIIPIVRINLFVRDAEPTNLYYTVVRCVGGFITVFAIACMFMLWRG